MPRWYTILAYSLDALALIAFTVYLFRWSYDMERGWLMSIFFGTLLVRSLLPLLFRLLNKPSAGEEPPKQ